MVNLERAKQTLRVEHSEEDSYVEFLIEVAAEYVSGLCDYVNDANAPKAYDICVLLLVSHLFENRSIVTDVSKFTVPYGFRSFLAQINNYKGV